MEARQVAKLLELLGMNSRYRGYPYLICSICHVKRNQELLFSTSEKLYSLVGKKYRVTPGIVGQDIRTLLKSYWTPDKARLFNRIIGYPVKEKMAPKEFIAVVASYLSHFQS